MTKFTATFASTAAALLLAGNAFAFGPASGEAPLFNGPDAAAGVVSSVQRQDVRVSGLAQMPESGEVSQAVAAVKPAYSRAEVRAQTREALGSGYVVKTGNLS